MKADDLAFWEERLEEEKIHLKKLYEFSDNVEHSGTMDCKNRIRDYETKINKLKQEK